MSISKKKNRPFWFTRFTIAGVRIQESTRCTSRAEAEEYEEKRRREVRAQILLGKKSRYTWSAAVVEWCKGMQHKKSLHTDLHHFKWLQPRLEKYTLNEINKTVIDQLANEKAANGCKAATINRMLNVVSAVLNKAHKEWEWIDRVPVIPMRKGANIKRERWLTKEEAKTLLAELPPHLSAMAHFTLCTGLRASNVTKLLWSQIDMANRHITIHATKSKNNRSFGVPLNQEAISILKKQLGKHHEYVFTYGGHPVNQCCTKAWFKAVKRAKLEDFRWHDLRHTWASWHVQNGTSLQELVELGGWSSFDMVLRYAHLSSNHLKEAAERLSGDKLVTQESHQFKKTS